MSLLPQVTAKQVADRRIVLSHEDAARLDRPRDLLSSGSSGRRTRNRSKRLDRFINQVKCLAAEFCDREEFRVIVVEESRDPPCAAAPHRSRSRSSITLSGRDSCLRRGVAVHPIGPTRNVSIISDIRSAVDRIRSTSPIARLHAWILFSPTRIRQSSFTARIGARIASTSGQQIETCLHVHCPATARRPDASGIMTCLQDL